VTLLPWVVIAVLITVNALYVAAELAAVALPRHQLSGLVKDGHARARELLRVVDDAGELDRYIAACQIGITLSSLIAGAYGQATIAAELAPLLATVFGMSESTAQPTAAVGVLFLLTASQVVLGELLPKSLALSFPLRTALATYLPMRASVSLYRYFIWLLNGSGLFILRAFKVPPSGHHHVHSPEEIALLLDESQRGGRITIAAHDRLQRSLRLSERTVRHLMIPRSELEAVELSSPPEQLLERVRASSHTRLPVYDKSLDQIVGSVSVKDLVVMYSATGKLPPLKDAVRPVPFVPDSLPADQLVGFLQERRSSMAIVVDEYGGVQGLVSVEDLLSEVFGDPDAGHDVQRLPSGELRLPGDLSLTDAERWLGTRLDGDSSTLGGAIVETLRRLPEVGESVTLGGVTLRVVEMRRTVVGAVIGKPLRESPVPGTPVGDA
jgi:putative hemolysin